MVFDKTVIDEICKNVITAVADPEIWDAPEFGIINRYIVTIREFDIIADSIGNAIGPYIIAIGRHGRMALIRIYDEMYNEISYFEFHIIKKARVKNE